MPEVIDGIIARFHGKRSGQPEVSSSLPQVDHTGPWEIRKEFARRVHAGKFAQPQKPV